MTKNRKRVISAAKRKVPATADEIHRSARAFTFAYERIVEANSEVQTAYRTEPRNRFNISPETMRQIEAGEIKISMGPDVVCIAFSVELYLKARILADTQERIKGHEIVVLFEKLSLARQRELIDGTAALNLAIDPSQFHAQLMNLNNAFIEWRYSFEFTSLSFPTTFAHCLARAIRATFEPLT